LGIIEEAIGIGQGIDERRIGKPSGDPDPRAAPLF
jgi:hypothetical protein